METKKKALGMGLEQLFNNENLDLDTFEKQVYENIKQEEILEININELRPNPYQPRKIFSDDSLQELANSIKEYGIFQPIITKKSIKGYDIIAGERRVRAAKIAGLSKVPAIIRNLTDNQMLEIGLLENLQRENLNVIEEALAYKALIEKLNLTQDQLAQKVGKSRSHITNILGILRLPNEVQKMVINNDITMGHARALSKLEDDNKIVELAHQIKDNNLTVHAIENISSMDQKKIKIKRVSENKYKYVEEIFRDKLDTKVKIKNKKIEINFTNDADLNRILDILNIKEKNEL